MPACEAMLDDRSLPLPEHHPPDRLTGAKASGQVDQQGPVPFRRTEILGWRERDHSGAVDEDVNPTVLHDHFESVVNLRWIGDVAAHQLGLVCG